MAELKEEKVYQISENYGVGADPYCIVFYEKYEKMDKRGKGGTPTGEFGWRPAKGGAYVGTTDNLANLIKRRAELETIDAVGFDFEPFVTYMDKWLEDLKSHLNQNITLVLGKVKDLSESDEKDGKKK